MTTLIREPRLGTIGGAHPRVDGNLKVRGEARYAGDARVEAPLFAALVGSTISRGRIRAFDESAARAVPGVVEVLTFRNAPRLQPASFDFEAGTTAVEGATLPPLQDDRVFYWGQYVAAVIADSLEAAQAAAALVRVDYLSEPINVTVDDFVRENADVPAMSPFGSDMQVRRGDFVTAFENAPVRIDARYATPPEHHNPMEPMATIASWRGDDLTIYDSTQFVYGVQSTLAAMFGIEAARVHVICPFVGGGFGSKGFVWPHVGIAALAAKQTGKAVKLVLARDQMFTSAGYRSQTEQRLRLGATSDGKLVAIGHDVLSITSHVFDFPETAGVITPMLYACDNVTVSHRLARLDVGTPTAMRAPGEAPGSFALECAIDELAWTLGLDPIELRLRNEPQVDGQSGLPFTSRQLVECFRVGAERFGWNARSREPRSMRDGDEFVGYGVAAATYPAMQQPSQAKLTVDAHGRFLLEIGAADLGTGTYTIATQLVASELGVPFDAIEVRIGDSNLPRGPIAGGSMTAASIAPVIADVARALRTVARVSDDLADQHDAFRKAAEDAGGKLETEVSYDPDDVDSKYSAHSFGAQFCEVRYDEAIARLRVTRLLSVLDVGRVLNATTARSQAIGGAVWGVSMALFEETVRDRRSGAIVTNNLADYHVAVNADIPPIDVHFVEEPDYAFNPLGVRGIGEIGIVGVAAAVANALYHASGIRVRDLPILPEKLLGA